MNVESKTFFAPEDQVAHLGTDPIPAKYYYDPDWYELERKAIFMRTWIWVGHVCELPEPGTWFRRELEFANASILIVRGKDGEIRAFHNVCTHRGAQLTVIAEGPTVIAAIGWPSAAAITVGPSAMTVSCAPRPISSGSSSKSQNAVFRRWPSMSARG